MSASQTISGSRDAFVSFAHRHNLLVPHKSDWRLCEPRTGEIHGLPGSRGRLCATDGILCFILRGDGSIFTAHIAHFIPDKAVRVYTPKTTKRSNALLEALLA